MRVKIANPEAAAGLKDPQTKRSPFLDADGKLVVEADVPENIHWLRRVRSGEVIRVDETTMPTGREPVAPLTTRGGK